MRDYRLKVVLLIFLFFEVAFLTMFVLFLNNNKKLKYELVDKKNELETTRNSITNFNETKKSFDSVFEESEFLHESFIDKENIVEVIADLEKMANQSEVEIKIRTKSQIERRKSGNEDKGDLGNKKEFENGLYITSRSNFEQLVEFISKLEGMKKILFVSKIDVDEKIVDEFNFSVLNEDEIDQFIEENNNRDTERGNLEAQILIEY